MTLSFLQQRIVRVLTRPPEIMFALTRHWLLITVCFLVGTGVMWSRLVSAPPIYEGHAQLLVNKNDSILATFSEIGAQTSRDGDIWGFLNSQSAILQSDSVIRKLLLCTGFSWTPDLGSESGEETFENKLESFTRNLSEFLHIQQPPLDRDNQENAMQRLIQDFKLRSAVMTNKKTSTIDLILYGVEHETIEQELRCWIEAYRNHLAEMGRRTWEDFLSERSRNYARLRETALRELQTFTGENANVSEARRELLSEQTVQNTIELNNLRFRIAESAPASVTTRRMEDPEFTALLREKTTLEMKRLGLLANRFSEESTAVQSITKRLRGVEIKLAGFETIAAEELPDDNGYEARQSTIEKRAATLTVELKRLWTEKYEISDKLKEHRILESRYANANENHERFELMKLEAIHLMESPLNVQVSDEPSVNTEPAGLPPLLKLAAGSALGVFLGMGLALLLEILCGRIRFKHDLIDDFGLPVVAVLPK